MKEQYEV